MARVMLGGAEGVKLSRQAISYHLTRYLRPGLVVRKGNSPHSRARWRTVR